MPRERLLAVPSQRPQDLVARRLQRMGICDRRDQPVGRLDGHVLIRRQIVGAVDEFGAQTARVAGRDQLVALCIAAHGAQQTGGEPEARAAPWRC